MRIGELARRSGLATTALRYYEKAGLLPRSARTVSGYRDYAGDTLPRLTFVRAAQAIGLTVAEIREVIGIRDCGTAPCAHLLELIERHRAQVRARSNELQQLEQDLALVAEQGARVDPAECDPAGICTIIPAQAPDVRLPTRVRRGRSDGGPARAERTPRGSSRITRSRLTR
jgi:MerR family transcriptional regulator, copper efflux regulator